MSWLYTLVIQSLALAFRLGKHFNAKLKKGYTGRQKQDVVRVKKSTWFHCASHGEYEIIAPVIRELKQTIDIPIVVSFFSPSGVEHSTAVKDVDFVYYMPLDLKKHIRSFVSKINPKMVIFVKAEFWYNTLSHLTDMSIPYLFVASTFGHNQFFFRPGFGYFKRKLLDAEHIFTQDQSSFDVLKSNRFTQITKSGNPRIDQVLNVAQKAQYFPIIERFKGDKRLLIVGSSWPAEEEMLSRIWKQLDDYQLLFAPHDISDSRVQEIKACFGVQNCHVYGEIGNDENYQPTNPILILNKIGMLSSLYRYANIAMVGGGFRKKGLHNTLEPASYNIPVIIGPEYDHFPEAVQMVSKHILYPVDTADELLATIQKLASEQQQYALAKRAKHFFEENRGTGKLIANYLQELLDSNS